MEYIIENLQKRAAQIYKDEEELRPLSASAIATGTAASASASVSAGGGAGGTVITPDIVKNVMEELDVYSNILSTKSKEVRNITFINLLFY